LEHCYYKCGNETLDFLPDAIPDTTNEQQDFSFDLHCRDSRRLLIAVNHPKGFSTNEKFIYMLTLQETRIQFIDRFVYLVSCAKLCGAFS